MLYRKITDLIVSRLRQDSDKVLVVSGARQIGKSYIVRHCGTRLFKNFVEINLIEDANGDKIFSQVRTTDEFYLALSAFTSSPLGTAEDTLVFLDEIQQYPQLLTLLKFLRQENRYRYVASGSLLGVTLRATASVPMGSIDVVKMYPLDFEEFMMANDFGAQAIEHLRECFHRCESPAEGIHQKVMELYRRYLLVGGLPDAVNKFLETRDLVQVRAVQRDIMELYKIDAGKYDREHSLKISRIYDMIPSNMENRKKRVVYREIEGKKGKRSSDYEEEIEYLISAGIALEVKAIANPKFPLRETESKNLLKLYLNDPGLLTMVLYHNNPAPVLNTQASINLGSVYECAVACQLAANNNALFYYDNRNNGEVDFLIDDYQRLAACPLEVKSGKDYKIHSAMNRLLANEDYHIPHGYVLSNSGEVESTGKITYIPVYMALFFDNRMEARGPVLI